MAHESDKQLKEVQAIHLGSFSEHIDWCVETLKESDMDSETDYCIIIQKRKGGNVRYIVSKDFVTDHSLLGTLELVKVGIMRDIL